MPVFNKFIDGLLYKGGFLAAGIACLFLAKCDFLPRILNPVYIGLASVGAFGFILNFVMEHDDEDPTYQERMREFFRIKPMLEAKLREQAMLMREYQMYKRRLDDIDLLTLESENFAKKIESMKRSRDRRSEAGPSDENVRTRQSSKTFEDIPRASRSPRKKTSSCGEKDLIDILDKSKPAF